MEEFVRNLAELLERDVGNINPDDLFRDYEEWDSLAMLGLGAMVDENYDMVIPRKEFEKMNTVKELFEYIQNNK